MNGQQFNLSVGQVSVTTTSDGGHPPEFYAERLVDQLIHVSDTAPEAIRMQALAYQETMRQMILAGIKKAILSDHTTVIARLRKAGMNDAAALVYDLHRR